MIKIAQISCGTEYSGIQREIEKAASMVNAEIIFPDVSYEYIKETTEIIGFEVQSSGLQLMFARARALVEGLVDADAVFLATCFRCAEGALLKNEVRRYLQRESNIPVVMYSFTQHTKADELLTRMEALQTIAERKQLLARKRQEGLTLGIDSGSATTKAVVMRDNEVIGTGWYPTQAVMLSANKVVNDALKEAGVKLKDIEAIGTTGYGRHTLGKQFKAKLIQEELTVNSKGAVWAANRQEGEATVIDIGGMDNKVITINNGIPDSFTMGGICAGASGRFLEITSNRLGIDISELGGLAMQGNPKNVSMASYCVIFGIQDLVTELAAGVAKEDIAAAACYSVAEQVFEQQLQEVDIREPVIQVGGTSLIEGLNKAFEDILNLKPIVPKYSQFIGSIGGALLSSAMIGEE
ncbi:MAG: methanogenesis marker 15 protein [Candidatus Methanofastidiosa archaeon]|nr:methanogenesis marker 15 protein [Candidatus Methanofastidiosa archaeon]